MNLLIKTILVSTLSLSSVSVFSFGLGDLAGAVNKKEATSSVDSYAAQDGLVKQYLKASLSITVAQQQFAEALGMKEEAAALGAEVDAMKSGAVMDTDALERISESTTSSNEALSTRLESTEELSAEAKKEFAKALIPYFVGLLETSKISGSASDFISGAKNTISSASMMQKLKVTKKLSSGMYVAKEIPGFGANLYSTSKTLVSFAKSQGIDVPDDAMQEISFN